MALLNELAKQIKKVFRPKKREYFRPYPKTQTVEERPKQRKRVLMRSKASSWRACKPCRRLLRKYWERRYSMLQEKITS